MAEVPANVNRDHWQAKAREVARTVNLAWWLETMAAPLVMAAILGAIGLIVARREAPDIQPWILYSSIGGGLLLLGLVCWAAAVRKFEKPADSMVRMEASMRLRNALSAAQAGVAPWPAPVHKIDAGLAWQWPRLLVPPLGALVLLAAGLLVPVSKGTQVTAPPDQPLAWTQLGDDLDRLTKEDVVDEKYLEETRKRLEELKSQEEEQWFSHSSLEATDSLKKSHASETQRVEKELGRADKALGQLEKNAAGMNQAEKNRLMDEFDQALQGLQNGAMKPNPKLLEQMKQMDLKNMANLTPEQMQQMRDNLKKNAEAMKGEGQGGQGDDWSDELLAGDGEGKDGNGNGEGDGEGDGEGKDGEGGGKGGVDRGPGHVPGVLGKEKDQLETGKLTGLEATDLSKSTPGDLLELQDGEHDVDKSASGISAGGATDATGKGGDRVWRDALDPAEQQTLKKFFE